MSLHNINEIVATIESLYVNLPRPIALHQPSITGKEWDYVKQCLDSGWLSSVGQYVTQFEQQLASITRAKHAIAVINGTSALHLGLKAIQVKENDEVLIPALTFVATANAVSYCGAVPHFVDADADNFCIDTVKLEMYLKKNTASKNGECFNKLTGRRIKAAVSVHAFGHFANMQDLLTICRKFHIDLIEDAAEALGSTRNGNHSGSWGRLAILSFNGNKIITCGGGGAILTNDENLAVKLKHLSTTAKISHPWEISHNEIGYNYRLPNINAALGLAQLEQLPRFVRSKRLIAKRYFNAFKDHEYCKMVQEPADEESNYWLNLLLLKSQFSYMRDEIIQELHNKEI